MSLSVREYLVRARDQIIPPLVLELILRSGKSFYIKSVFPVDEKAEMVPLCVWDLRALSQADLDTVLRRLGAVRAGISWKTSSACTPSSTRAISGCWCRRSRRSWNGTATSGPAWIAPKPARSWSASGPEASRRPAMCSTIGGGRGGSAGPLTLFLAR